MRQSLRSSLRRFRQSAMVKLREVHSAGNHLRCQLISFGYVSVRRFPWFSKSVKQATKVGRYSLDEGVRRILGEGYLFLECIWLHRSKARRLLILLVFRRTFQIRTSFDFVSPEPSRTRREGTEEISTKFKEPYHSQHAVLKLS